ncbi:TPA: flagella biosynthesis chaperone FlgN [Enterobacter chengduensis]|nr:flagella biosynthesis chaperone FlgN [Enterobacter chengduensis]
MSRLSEILDQMTVVLNELKTVMDAEQQHLSSGQINGSALQRITEDKSSLLATLDYLEQQRRAEQDSTRSANDDIIERWQTITEKTQHLRHLNQHNGWLLEGQIERNQQALEVLKPHKEPGLYGADGQASPSRLNGGKKISI